MGKPVSYAAIAAALAPLGLIPRGGLAPDSADHLPGVATLVLVGNAGPAMWRAFKAALADGMVDGEPPDPLDRWTRRVLGRVAGELGAEALFPFGGPPWHPFIRWAMRAEGLSPSPLGMLIHPDFGLWHAYRGALAFSHPIDLPPRRACARAQRAVDARPSPCESCADRPCLAACPVEAFTGAGYDVAACVGHIGAQAGRDCLTGGCRARRACPVGRDYAYEAAQAEFHMTAFLKARRGPAG